MSDRTNTFPRWQIRDASGALMMGEYAWMDGGDGPEPEWDCLDGYEPHIGEPMHFEAVQVTPIRKIERTLRTDETEDGWGDLVVTEHEVEL